DQGGGDRHLLFNSTRDYAVESTAVESAVNPGAVVRDSGTVPTGGMKSAELYQGLRKPKPIKPTTSNQLLPTELDMGRFGDIPQVPGDNITPHHMPSAEYMKQKAGIDPQQSLAMNVEAPRVGGRHARTESFARKPFLDETFRDALARDVAEQRRLYRQDGLYTPVVRDALQKYISKSIETFPELFGK
ncbi:MAG: hypothetical protein JST54_34055, partial [Deltaproteobacteria bacterium]|nr:hypothetical protein [Deltaproteobacteria bacterium]